MYVPLAEGSGMKEGTKAKDRLESRMIYADPLVMVRFGLHPTR